MVIVTVVLVRRVTFEDLKKISSWSPFLGNLAVTIFFMAVLIGCELFLPIPEEC